LPSEEDRATATGNMYSKLGEIWACGFLHVRVDRQTNKRTNEQTDKPPCRQELEPRSVQLTIQAQRTLWLS